MPLFFFQLRHRDDQFVDPDGAELPDIASATRHALRTARTILGHDVADDGVLDLNFRIDIEDSSGTILHRVTFADAVRVILPESNGATK